MRVSCLHVGFKVSKLELTFSFWKVLYIYTVWHVLHDWRHLYNFVGNTELRGEGDRSEKEPPQRSSLAGWETGPTRLTPRFNQDAHAVSRKAWKCELAHTAVQAGIWLDEMKLCITWPAVCSGCSEGKCIPGSISSSTASRWRDVGLSCSAWCVLDKSGTQFWPCQFWRHRKLQRAQWRAGLIAIGKKVAGPYSVEPREDSGECNYSLAVPTR